MRARARFVFRTHIDRKSAPGPMLSWGRLDCLHQPKPPHTRLPHHRLTQAGPQARAPASPLLSQGSSHPLCSPSLLSEPDPQQTPTRVRSPGVFSALTSSCHSDPERGTVFCSAGASFPEPKGMLLVRVSRVKSDVGPGSACREYCSSEKKKTHVTTARTP